jgi:UDP-N-acetylmuramyl pentapeptide phosphotransferase/UDP-N-acetylglucosamine-1-phosphate transferase
LSYLSIGLLVCLLTLVAHWLLAARAPEGASPSRAGGIVVAGAALFLGFLATRLPIGAAHVPAAGLVPVLAGASLIALIGWIDDHRPLPPLLKLAGQVAAAAITYGLGLSAGFMAPGWFNAALVIFCLVGGANALNLVDGVDGLAGAVSLIAAATIFAVARNAGNIEAAVLAAALAGGMLAFLWQNLPPARVYLGDGGSNFVGFTLAALPLLLSGGVSSTSRRPCSSWPCRSSRRPPPSAAAWPRGAARCAATASTSTTGCSARGGRSARWSASAPASRPSSARSSSSAGTSWPARPRTCAR